ncbi:hypothetical protein SAV14893_090830 [Streptomyces avermitilis]|uniref:Uncharacterized protein n=1 Tax=Streptomyces avermitilis TaxID=33903 RepID=A0A4D4MCN8_STRAX|nr:hypothetical protein SAVMC3_05730 [Streptomyces avermitilis]GDY69690.1 hypothetical protein SAV14893_090830 [Streptomyces avermitilis]
MAVRTGDGTGPRSVLAPGTGSDQDVWLHYGFTSTGMWISSQCGHSAVLLTNKIQYARDRSDAARCCQSSPAGKPPGEEDTSSRAIAEGEACSEYGAGRALAPGPRCHPPLHPPCRVRSAEP